MPLDSAQKYKRMGCSYHNINCRQMLVHKYTYCYIQHFWTEIQGIHETYSYAWNTGLLQADFSLFLLLLAITPKIIKLTWYNAVFLHQDSITLPPLLNHSHTNAKFNLTMTSLGHWTKSINIIKNSDCWMPIASLCLKMAITFRCKSQMLQFCVRS